MKKKKNSVHETSNSHQRATLHFHSTLNEYKWWKFLIFLKKNYLLTNKILTK